MSLIGGNSPPYPYQQVRQSQTCSHPAPTEWSQGHIPNNFCSEQSAQGRSQEMHLQQSDGFPGLRIRRDVSYQRAGRGSCSRFLENYPKTAVANKEHALNRLPERDCSLNMLISIFDTLVAQRKRVCQTHF